MKATVFFLAFLSVALAQSSAQAEEPAPALTLNPYVQGFVDSLMGWTFDPNMAQCVDNFFPVLHSYINIWHSVSQYDF